MLNQVERGLLSSNIPNEEEIYSRRQYYYKIGGIGAFVLAGLGMTFGIATFIRGYPKESYYILYPAFCLAFFGVGCLCGLGASLAVPSAPIRQNYGTM